MFFVAFGNSLSGIAQKYPAGSRVFVTASRFEARNKPIIPADQVESSETRACVREDRISQTAINTP